MKTFEIMGDPSEGLTVVRDENNKHGFINSKGEVVIPATYREAWGFSNGFAVVRNGDSHGGINNKGELILPIIYRYFEEARGFLNECLNQTF